MAQPSRPLLAQPLHLLGVQMSAADYVAVNYRLWRARPVTRRNHWLLGLAGLLLAVSVGLDVLQHGRISNWATVGFLALAAGYALFRMRLVRYQLGRGYTRNPALHQPIDFSLTTAEISGRSSLGHFTSQWKLIRRAVWVGPDWLLLYPTEATCYYLDLRRLQAPAAPTDVEQLLVQHQIPQQRL